MRRDPRAYLWDAVQAITHVQRFTRDRTFDDYKADILLRSGVERQLEIAGEALNQLSRTDPALAARVPELASIVGFRNVLIHGYATVDDTRVWNVIEHNVPALHTVITQLLHELDTLT
jgi:uncharacterized protein with HEPN domain